MRTPILALLLACAVPAAFGQGQFEAHMDQLAAPQAQVSWLGNPSAHYWARAEAGALHLVVRGSGTGMKWSAPLAGWPDLTPYRYVTIRYRARGIAPGDYFLWLGSATEKSANLVPLAGIEDDGGWHTDVLAMSVPFTPVTVAMQVQSHAPVAEAWIDSARFSVDRPVLSVTAALPLNPGLADVRLPASAARMIELPHAASVPADPWLRQLGFTTYPVQSGPITACGIPFAVTATGLATQAGIEHPLTIPLPGSASEIYLLMAARLPAQDFSGVEGGMPMRRFDNPERFTARVVYSDGVVDEIFPVRVGSGRCEVRSGLEVYCLGRLRSRPLRSVTLRSRMETAGFLVWGVTLNSGRAITPPPRVAALPAPAPARPEPPCRPSIAPLSTGKGYVVSNGRLRLEIGTTPGISLRSAENRCLRGGRMSLQPGPLFEVGIGEKLVASTRLAVGTPHVLRDSRSITLAVPVDATGAGIPLKGELLCATDRGPDIRLQLRLKLTGDGPATPIVHFPLVSGIRIGSSADTWYLWCRKGGWVNRAPCSDRRHYGGEYPLQVADLFNPALGGGISLATYDLNDIYKVWGLDKDDGGASWRIEYMPREYSPGETIEIAPTALRAHSGDWRAALRAYRRWASTWYRPLVARKPWFQRSFNYRQHYAWTDLRDPHTGAWRLDEVIAADRAFFGCLDYLHIFDFGQSQKYGRVGDYNHYDELGGREAMAGAIAGAKRQGVHVGLYIEGYLCDRNSVWGRDNVLRWGIRQADGKPLLWAGDSTEHMMCAGAVGWRSHLAEVYHRVAEELAPSGMYIDQYGFGDTWKMCHSREHGHPVPSDPVLGERGTLQAIRTSVPPDIATLTEETTCDVNSQYQDGALGYSVANSDPDLSPERVDLFRFEFPSFKVFQLVSYNDFVEGGWSLLKGPFFNGEGTWLANSVPAGICPDARDFLRRAFGVLHRYAEAFTSSDVEALAPTLIPTVYANRFAGPQSTVWTLFNAEYRTVRGELLRVPSRPGARYLDAFTGKQLPVRRRRGSVFVSTTLGPRDVGCVVEERAK